MAELLIRAGSQDAALLKRVFGLDGGRGSVWRPDRLVVDAHVPGQTSDLAVIARRAGIPLLVDPQTYYLQDRQHPGDAWAQLPFATAESLSAADLSVRQTQDRLIAACVRYQIEAGATAIIPPYVHLEQADDDYIGVQADLWHRTAVYLADRQIELPVVAVAALGWRLLNQVTGARALAPLWNALADLKPAEVAVAASRIHLGVRPHDRLNELVGLISQLSLQYPVLAWQQGLLGEACVAAGAVGYETGIARREHCDVRTAKANRRALPQSAPRSARPVYVSHLGRAIPKNSVRELRKHRTIWTEVLCDDPRCCPAGDQVLGDARQHAIISRARDLAELGSVPRESWRWTRLAERSRAGLRVGAKINALAGRTPTMAKVDLGALSAINTVAEQRRQHRRTRRAA